MAGALPTKRSFRSCAQLGRRLEETLSGYTVTALAAGVGLFVLSSPAEGKIVYTAAHKTIFPNTTLFIDLNNDGTQDFSISNRASHGGTSHNKFYNGDVVLSGLGRSTNAAVPYYQFVAALNPRVTVGSQTRFGGSGFMFNCVVTNSFGSQTGPWSQVKSRYLGLRFSINGQIHYGWARLSSKLGTLPCQVTLVLSGYAYETVPNKSIETGKMSGPDSAEGPESNNETLNDNSLGFLALGASGLSIWKRNKAECFGSLGPE